MQKCPYCVVYTTLVASSEKYDSLTLDILSYLCSTLAAFTTRRLADHLPGGKYHHAPDLAAETASVPKTNVISERDFAQLDRLIREKPDADTIALEGMILFSNNTTAGWLHSLPCDKQSQLIELARHSASSTRQQFKDRQAAIREFRLSELKRKQEEKEKKRQAEMARKEQLTKDIEPHGLWTRDTGIDAKLSAIPTVTGRRAALRSQLHFRKFVLEQKAEKDLFHMSSAGHDVPVEKLIGLHGDPGSDASTTLSVAASS